MKFTNENLGVEINTHVGKDGTVWFKGKDIAISLGYKCPKSAIQSNVDKEYKRTAEQLSVGGQPNAMWISEAGLYCLLFHCRMVSNEVLEKWITLEVIPSIRGQYEISRNKRFDTPNKLVFKIENEYDLHTKVVEFVRKRYPGALITAGLGELQDTSRKRIDSWKKGYQKGQPDLIIQNQHKTYGGLCVEFKTPQGNGVLSTAQEELLERYKTNNYKVIVSNDYDSILGEIREYMDGVYL